MRSHSYTAFSWGYWGWGTAVPRFLEAAAAAEGARGFDPPAFADIRLSRSVRAPGFRDNAFEAAVGRERYRWFKGLGNAAIATNESGVIRIAEPGQTEDLLDYVILQARANRRVIFFCACEYLERNGAPLCHRALVATLLLETARRRSLPLTVVEWPGGDPEDREVEIPSWKGWNRVALPLGSELPRDGLATLPWYSFVRVRVGSERRAILSGPARFTGGEWRIPNRGEAESHDDQGWAALRRYVPILRSRLGLNPRSS